MNRSGEFVVNMSGDATYKSFRPAPLPPQPKLEINSETLKLLVQANRLLALLDSASRLIPNTDLFVSMYVRKEALMSSQIEGTQCTLDDVLDPDIELNANADVTDVINYVHAAQFSLNLLNTLPICNRLLRETHAVLMEGVRGQDKNPGEFRRSQNWIGPQNCNLNEARFIPPNTEIATPSIAILVPKSLLILLVKY